MACICQQCGKDFKVDLIIPDRLWEKIKPDGKPEGAGLLCGACIMDKLESFNVYGVIDGEDGDSSMRRL